jgi:hypothetical protein
MANISGPQSNSSRTGGSADADKVTVGWAVRTLLGTCVVAALFIAVILGSAWSAAWAGLSVGWSLVAHPVSLLSLVLVQPVFQLVLMAVASG